MNETQRRFFDQMDKDLIPVADGQTLNLYLLGRAALMTRYQVTLSTKDIDVVQMGAPLEETARELFGMGSERAKELDLYLDLVPDGLPPLPQGFQNRCTAIEGDGR